MLVFVVFVKDHCTLKHGAVGRAEPWRLCSSFFASYADSTKPCCRCSRGCRVSWPLNHIGCWHFLTFGWLGGVAYIDLDRNALIVGCLYSCFGPLAVVVAVANDSVGIAKPYFHNVHLSRLRTSPVLVSSPSVLGRGRHDASVVCYGNLALG